LRGNGTDQGQLAWARLQAAHYMLTELNTQVAVLRVTQKADQQTAIGYSEVDGLRALFHGYVLGL